MVWCGFGLVCRLLMSQTVSVIQYKQYKQSNNLVIVLIDTYVHLSQ